MALLTGHISGYPGSTSVVHTTPFPVKPGTRARDVDGNEYVYCDFTGTIYGRTPVVISSDYTAAPITIATGNTNVLGVACTYGTSDNAGWVQIYGRCLMQVGINAASPSDAAAGPTTLRTSAATIFIVPTSITSPAVLGYVSVLTSGVEPYVIGMYVATDASVGDVSAVTSATSHIGSEIAVFLNYPAITLMHGTC